MRFHRWQQWTKITTIVSLPGAIVAPASMAKKNFHVEVRRRVGYLTLPHDSSCWWGVLLKWHGVNELQIELGANLTSVFGARPWFEDRRAIDAN